MQTNFDCKEFLTEFVKLKEKLFGSDSFVEVDDNNPDWIRYNKMVPIYLNILKAITK